MLDHNDNSALPGGPSRPSDINEAFAAASDFEALHNIAGWFDFVARFRKFRALPNIIFLHYNDMSNHARLA